MKKLNIYILTTALTLMSCQVDSEVDQAIASANSVLGQTLTVSSPAYSDNTRVEFTDGASAISLYWETGDSFTIYDSAGDRVDDFVYLEKKDDNSVVFAMVSDDTSLVDGEEYSAIFPTVDGVTTLDNHRAELASRVAEQTQIGSESSDHLNKTLHMEASFTYSDDDSTVVKFSHIMAVMRLTFEVEDEITPIKLIFSDGDYATYTLYIEQVSASNTYTAYYVINPNEGGERELISTVFVNDNDFTSERQLYIKSDIQYFAGRCYSATISSATLYTPISTAEELYNIRYNLSGKYKLTKDVDLSKYGNWEPIGSYTTSYNMSPFTGTLDGYNHAIIGLTIDTESSYQGLFSCMASATVKNLVFKEPSISGGDNIGSLVGYTANYSTNATNTIENCSVQGGSVIGSGNYIGGLCGVNNGYVINCYNTATVSGKSYVGSIAGTGNITYCYNTATVSGNSYVGGIAGAGNITSCYNTGNVTSGYTSWTYAGGIVGSGSAIGCYNTGEVSGGHFVGGIAGSGSDSYSYYISCYNTGSVSGNYNSNDRVGGILGFVGSNFDDRTVDIISCYNTGTISGSLYVGGLLGQTLATTTSILSSYFIYVDGDRASKGVANWYYDSPDDISDMKLSSVEELNSKVVEMKQAATDAGYGNYIFTQGSPVSTHLPYLFNENLEY